VLEEAELGDFLNGEEPSSNPTPKETSNYFLKRIFQVPTTPTYLKNKIVQKKIIIIIIIIIILDKSFNHGQHPPPSPPPKEHDSHGVVATGWPGPSYRGSTGQKRG
jgi:hypothetical protein